MWKLCRRCGETKPMEDFYKHSAMADGFLNVCKVCVKERVSQHRARNLERIKEYDRNRPNAEERKKLHAARYARGMKDPERKAKFLAAKQRWFDRNSLKRRAHVMVGNAIKYGHLKKAPCERCGEQKVDAHHEDYRFPMAVTWLCRPCHGRRHKEINEERRKGKAA